MIRFTLLTAGVAALGLMAACAPQPAPSAIGMANPASVSCLQKGGQSEIRSSAEGQYGVCRFADGRECEEWALHRDNRCIRPD